jgi:hypothetical protein
MSTDATETTPERPPRVTPHEKPTGSDDEAFGPDEVFHLLQNQRRREVLRRLRDVDEPVEMAEVAEQVAARENDTTVEALTSTERQRVYIALYQRHLPKLDDFDVIDYNQSRGVVTPTDRASWMARYLDLPADGRARDLADERLDTDDPEEEPDPHDELDPDVTSAQDTDEPADDRGPAAPTQWPPYVAGVSVVATVVLALVGLNVPPFAALPELLVAAATVVTFLLLSLLRLGGPETVWSFGA